MNSITFSDYFEKDGRWLVSNLTLNYMLCIDYNKSVSTSVAIFPDVDCFHSYLHRKVYSYKDYLFFFPAGALYRTIDIYDIHTGKFSKSIFPDKINMHTSKAFEYERTGDLVWMISRDPAYPIIGFRLDDRKFIIKQRWNLRLQDICTKKMDLVLLGTTQVGSTIWITGNGIPTFIQIDTQTEEVKAHTIGKGTYRIELAAYDGERFWMTLSGSHRIISWEFVNNKVEEYYSTISDFIDDRRVFNRIICVKGHIFLLSLNGDQICILDKKEKKVTPIGKPVRDIVKSLTGNQFSNYVFGEWYLSENRVRICPCITGVMLVIDIGTLEVEGRVYSMPEEFFNKNYQEKVINLANSANREIMREQVNGVLDLSVLLEERGKVISGEADDAYKQKDDYGYRIYNSIKNLYIYQQP